MPEASEFSRRSAPDLAPWRAHERELSDVWAEVSRLLELGQLGSPEPEFLFSLSYNTEGRGAVVEIGTNIGTSLLMLAAAQRAKQNGRRVTAIDLQRHPELDSNLAKLGLAQSVDVIIGSSSEVATSWSQPIELLWIDGDHSRAGCALDIETWARFVIPNGLIALHDYADGMGVPFAVYESLLARPWEYRVLSDRTFGNIFVVEKLRDAVRQPWTDRMAPTTPTAAAQEQTEHGPQGKRPRLMQLLRRYRAT